MKIPSRFTVYDKLKLRANRYKILAQEIESYCSDLEAAGVNFEFMTKLDEALVMGEMEKRLNQKDEEISLVILGEMYCSNEVPNFVYTA